jgi:uncharacterized membrane protein
MVKIIVLAFIATVCFFILDALWFRIMGGFFRSEIFSLITIMSDGTWQVRITPAVLAYIFMGVGTTFFVLSQSSSLGSAALYGALFGIVTFGIYDMTNLALLSGWTVRFAVVDMLWGTFANAVVATTVFWIKNTFLV